MPRKLPASLSKTEQALLVKMLGHPYHYAHAQRSSGAGCRKGGEGHREFDALARLIQRRLAAEVSREGSRVYYKPGKSCSVVDLVAELTCAGRVLARELRSEA